MDIKNLTRLKEDLVKVKDLIEEYSNTCFIYYNHKYYGTSLLSLPKEANFSNTVVCFAGALYLYNNLEDISKGTLTIIKDYYELTEDQVYALFGDSMPYKLGDRIIEHNSTITKEEHFESIVDILEDDNFIKDNIEFI